MSTAVDNWIKGCGRCVRRKSNTNIRAPLVNISTSQPMELVCMDYLTFETSKGGFQNILVITDHFTRYAQAIPTRNQTARTTAEALFNNFIVHYGFPLQIHSDQGASFESQLIKQLCSVAGITKSRTTPYHPMGNGITERFNRTLLSMLGTLDPNKKTDWKSYISPLVHAYNSTRHETTGHSPFFLMFGRHLKLPVDKRLQDSYKLASDHIDQSQHKQKKYFDAKVRGAIIHIGDRVLVRQLAFEEKHKLADKWEEDVYIVHRQPNPEIPVFVLKREDGQGRSRTLHRNLLLPITSLPFILANEKPRRILPDKPPSTTRLRPHLPKTPVRKPQLSESNDGATPSGDDSLLEDYSDGFVVGPSVQEPPVVSAPNIAVIDAGEGTSSGDTTQPDIAISNGVEQDEEPEEEPLETETLSVDQELDQDDERDSIPESIGSNGGQDSVSCHDSSPESDHEVQGAEDTLPIPRRANRDRRPPARFRSGEFSMLQTACTPESTWREKATFLQALAESDFFLKSS
ncbi:uncharacterized protein LOC121381651 [Gigantopelta aegis]|uniref:uncharacterized protein LOC121381651 n=1 Tax=Gigantopelta aegis TaxID=1735272 RepID=UPI001B8883E8|nr:uncharacterized protein LOC121381651 [Gigantopelta aegis]